MIAGVRRVVAGRARAGERIGYRDAIWERLVVQAGDSGDRDRLGVEDLLATCNGGACATDMARRSGRIRPGVEKAEGTWIECRAGWIQPNRVVDTDVER